MDPAQRVGAYVGFGVLGLIFGIAVAVPAAATGSITKRAVVICTVAPLFGFAVALELGEIIAGYERIVFSEMFAACLAASAVGLYGFDEPIWPGLDAVTIGISTFLVFGRLAVGAASEMGHRVSAGARALAFRGTSWAFVRLRERHTTRTRRSHQSFATCKDR